MDAPHLDVLTRYVRALPGEFWLLREAATNLGVSRSRLRQLARTWPQKLGPGYAARFGDMTIYLYDEADLEQLRAYFADEDKPLQAHSVNGGRGRPSLWSVEEDEDRHRRRNSARYHHRRADHLDQQGHEELAAVHRARSRALTEQLHAERRERIAERD